jgi:hypothetical protein
MCSKSNKRKPCNLEALAPPTSKMIQTRPVIGMRARAGGSSPGSVGVPKPDTVLGPVRRWSFAPAGATPPELADTAKPGLGGFHSQPQPVVEIAGGGRRLGPEYRGDRVEWGAAALNLRRGGLLVRSAVIGRGTTPEPYRWAETRTPLTIKGRPGQRMFHKCSRRDSNPQPSDP